jgi:hypothetical protein
MKTKVNPSTKGKSLLVTFHEGYSTYTIVVPMPYAVKFFVDGLTSALGLLTQKNELQEKLSETEGQTIAQILQVCITRLVPSKEPALGKGRHINWTLEMDSGRQGSKGATLERPSFAHLSDCSQVQILKTSQREEDRRISHGRTLSL